MYAYSQRVALRNYASWYSIACSIYVSILHVVEVYRDHTIRFDRADILPACNAISTCCNPASVGSQAFRNGFAHMQETVRHTSPGGQYALTIVSRHNRSHVSLNDIKKE